MPNEGVEKSYFKTTLTVDIEHPIKRAFYEYCKRHNVDSGEAVQQMIEDLLARARIDPEDFEDAW